MVEPLDVVARRSTDVIAVEDPHVGAVLKFICENARWPIAVDDVVARGKLPRRSLEIRFRELLGRSIGEEIRAHFASRYASSFSRRQACRCGRSRRLPGSTV